MHRTYILHRKLQWFNQPLLNVFVPVDRLQNHLSNFIRNGNLRAVAGGGWLYFGVPPGDSTAAAAAQSSRSSA